MPTRILVTDADTPKALAIVRAIGGDYEVWTAAECGLTLAGCSRYARAHLRRRFSAPAEFPAWVLDQCKRLGIRIVVPPEESSSYLLALNEDAFTRHGIRLACLPLHALETAMDKAATIRAAEQIEVAAPPTRILEHRDDAVSAARELGHPVVIKPRFSRYWNGWRFVSGDGVVYANSDAQVREAVAALDPSAPPPIIQAFIPGSGVGVCMLLDDDGTPVAEFAHQRLRDYRPTGSGSVLRKSVALDPEMRETSLRLLRHIGARGVAMVEFRTDSRTGGFYLMEINGRFWGSLQLAIDSGVNFPALFVRQLLGEPVEKPNYRSGVHVRWWVGDLVRTLRVLKGRPRGYTGEFPSRWRAIAEFVGPQPPGTKNEILRWNDCWPAFVEPISILRRMFG